MPTVTRTTPRLPDLCTVAEAAEALSLTPHSVRLFIARGDLIAYRVGAKQIRLRVEDVAALLVRIPTGSVA
jgi:excisionase family DNA binding protein